MTGRDGSPDPYSRIHGGTKINIGSDHSISINPLGMPEGCRKAYETAFDMLIRYPETDCKRLIDRLSALYGNASVILGNGSSELIYAICHQMSCEHPGYGAVIVAPTFGGYEDAVRATGGKLTVIKTDEGNSFVRDEKVIKDIETAVDEDDNIRLVFFCNPDNPTGDLVRRELLEELAGYLSGRNVLLVCDECFLMFSEVFEETTMSSVLAGYPDVLVLNAFTKFYAMPGLRIGYALSCNIALLDKLRFRIQPWNISVPAYETALAALDDEGFVKETREYIRRERDFLINGFMRLGVGVVGVSAADYILIEAGAGLREALNRAGTDIRDCSDMMSYHDTVKSYYRTAVRTHDENAALLRAIEAYIGGVRS